MEAVSTMGRNATLSKIMETIGHAMTENEIVEFADKERQQIEGVGLSDGLAEIFRKIYKMLKSGETNGRYTN